MIKQHTDQGSIIQQNPRHYYNVARRLTRRINRFFLKTSEEKGYQYRTFPDKLGL